MQRPLSFASPLAVMAEASVEASAEDSLPVSSKISILGARELGSGIRNHYNVHSKGNSLGPLLVIFIDETKTM